MENGPASLIGQPLPRVDGIEKVTGHARYAAEFKPAGLAHGVLLQAAIGSGGVRCIDLSKTLTAPGVIDVLTRGNCPPFPLYPEHLRAQGWPGEQRAPLQDDVVHWHGQLLGMVVADSLEHARFAASCVHVEYQPSAPIVGMDDPRAIAEEPELFIGREKLQARRGDPEGAFAAAPDARKLEATYETPIENHNPIEMCSTIAVWEAPDRLLLYEATRWIKGIQMVAANAFGLPLDHVRVIAPFVGGAFGAKGFTWNHILVTAAAARLVGRPVKLHFSRPQMFDSAGQRARTRQTVSMATDQNGRLTALRHRTTTHASPVSQFTEPCGNMSRRLYACDHVEMTHRLVHVNSTSPCPMRAPGEAPGVFALECAMDEMAEKLGLDPLDFRLRNYAEVDPEEKRPWSSKQLRRCYGEAAARFGWSERPRAPRSLRGAGGSLRGWGMATAVYPANQMPASVRVRLDARGHVTLESATHEIGTGTYTSMTQLAADSLGLPPGRVTFALGDSDYPDAPVNGGSWLTVSVGAAVMAACEELKAKLVDLASAVPDAVWPGMPVGCRDGGVGALHDSGPWLPYAELLQKSGKPFLQAEAGSEPGKEREAWSFLSFGALFIEVEVEPWSGHILVSRAVGTYDVGRIVNPQLARSQLLGGITFAIGMALLEQTIPDSLTGRNVNPNLAEYLVPVCADTPAGIDLTFLDIPDPRIPGPGARGLGEIGIVGAAAAIANAVWHATGRRVRDLPITPDKLLG